MPAAMAQDEITPLTGDRFTTYGSMVRPPPADDAEVYADDADDMPFFAKGRDLGGIHVNHRYSRKERQTLASYESVDYLPPHSEVYKKWVRGQSYRFGFDRWLMMALIGFSVGTTGYFLHSIINVLADLRMYYPRLYLQMSPANYGFACLVAVGFTLLYLIVSASLVVFVSPNAGSSGIPEVMAYLNGTLLRHIFNVQTLVVKFASCILAVASGMPVGQEGPMIHIGSMIGAGLSQFKSDTMKFQLPFFKRFRNSQDRRNFISAGAAAGIATAFHAPVGGLLFSMEEVSSFWNETLSWQTFFCCMVAVITTDLLNTGFEDFKLGDIGTFRSSQYILFEVKHNFDYNLFVFVPTIILGVIGGLLGSIFVFLNLKINRARKKVMASIENPSLQKFVRLVEPLFVGVVYVTVCLLLPAAFPCAGKECARKAPDYNSSQACIVPHSDVSDSPFLVDDEVELYTCDPGVTINHTGVKYGNNTYNITFTNATFNPVASLLFVTGEKAIRHLLSRETYTEFTWSMLLAVFVLYFFSVCYASGTSISSGVVVPQLFIGALYGRALSQVLASPSADHNQASSPFAIDPGAMALIGAASFFGGVSRLTMSLVVIMMELTNDIQFLLPVMVTVMVAKWVGDLFTRSLYHSQMDLKCIPHLSSEPHVCSVKGKVVSLALFSAEQVMSCPVVTLRETESVRRVAAVLIDTQHGGFPVVRQTEDGTHVFEGLITRLELMVLVMKQAFNPESATDRLMSHVTEVDYDQLNIDRLSNPSHVEDTLRKYCRDDSFDHMEMCLKPYLNQSAMSVRRNFSLQRLLIMVRSMGIRHVTVVDSINRVVGIITRKDLMGFSIEEKLAQQSAHRMTIIS